MNFKKTFLELTKYTIPFGKENIIVPYLRNMIPELKKDSIGNYYITIGDSETLFTTHIDTYCTEVKKVNHKINGNFIETDGKTTLGGDNKNGMTILLYLIENNIPGTYYFFIGEEPLLSGGLYGSRNVLHSNPEFFSQFKRAIAFDRKEYGSVVIRQMARKCCSDEFADALVKSLTINGVKSFKDMEAYYTDTATFMDIIPEITNISAGGFGEHTFNEKTDMSYLKNVAEASINIKWEELPTIRKPGSVTTISDDQKKYNPNLFKNSEMNFNRVNNILVMFGYKCLNENEFDTGVHMMFSHWHKDSELYIKIIGDLISINKDIIGGYKEFKELFGITFDNLINEEDLLRKIYDTVQEKEDFNLSNDEMNDILSEFYSDSIELIEFITDNDECLIKQYITFDIENNIFKINDFSDEEN